MATVLSARKTRNVRRAAKLPRSIPIVTYLYGVDTCGHVTSGDTTTKGVNREREKKRDNKTIFVLVFLFGVETQGTKLSWVSFTVETSWKLVKKEGSVTVWLLAKSLLNVYHRQSVTRDRPHLMEGIALKAKETVGIPIRLKSWSDFPKNSQYSYQSRKKRKNSLDITFSTKRPATCLPPSNLSHTFFFKVCNDINMHEGQKCCNDGVRVWSIYLIIASNFKTHFFHFFCLWCRRIYQFLVVI